MKYLIASDIHGGAECCRQLLKRCEEEKADLLVLLGDLLYHGPRNELPSDYATKSAYEQLNAYADRILCVRGNCDAEVDQMVLHFPVMNPFLVLRDGGLTIALTHGHLYNEHALPPVPDLDVILCGHTHRPTLEDHLNFVYMNPGSVTLPMGGSSKSYMTLENGLFIWKTLDGGEYRRFQMTSRHGER